MNTFSERRDQWLDWHNKNPRIGQCFDRFALEAASTGRRVSHWLIVNRIRWEVQIATTGEDFKISNDFIAFYARNWIEKHPQHRSMFTIKRMPGEPWPFLSLYADLA